MSRPDGDRPADAQHQFHCTSPHCDVRLTPEPSQCGPFFCEYDDGNGLWITLEETPCDQAFSRCICPQE